MRSFLSPLSSRRLALGVMALAAGLALAAPIAVAQPITTDSRIKTFVYNPNEVYTITTHYGYQSNIEFGPKEEIDTISVGDRVAWQITPAGRRLFIRAMEENARTNMTIVTNFRAYQFDLRSSTADAVFGSEELTYVVRFFYPSNTMAEKELPIEYIQGQRQAFIPPVVTRPAPVAVAPVPAAPVIAPPVRQPSVSISPQPAPLAPASVVQAPLPASSIPAAINYRYTYSGPSEIAPTKIFDDGRTTYFKLRPNQNPSIAIVTAQGDPVPVTTRRTTDGLVAVDAVAPRFRMTQGARQVIVYNETGGEV